MKEENRIVELLAELLQRSDKHDEILVSQGGLLERHGKLLEKLVESQVELIHGQNQTNRTLEDIKVAIKDIANLDDRVRKLENAVFKKAR